MSTMDSDERNAPVPLIERIKKITARFNARPVLDDRTEDEVLGYDERGVPASALTEIDRE